MTILFFSVWWWQTQTAVNILCRFFGERIQFLHTAGFVLLTQLFVLATSKELCRSVTICIIQQVLLATRHMSNIESTRWNEDKSGRLDGEWGRQREGRTGREGRVKKTCEPGLNSEAECNCLLSLLYATPTEQRCLSYRANKCTVLMVWMQLQVICWILTITDTSSITVRKLLVPLFSISIQDSMFVLFFYVDSF